jgi:hypothetical protein
LLVSSSLAQEVLLNHTAITLNDWYLYFIYLYFKNIYLYTFYILFSCPRSLRQLISPTHSLVFLTNDLIFLQVPPATILYHFMWKLTSLMKKSLVEDSSLRNIFLSIWTLCVLMQNSRSVITITNIYVLFYCLKLFQHILTKL